MSPGAAHNRHRSVSNVATPAIFIAATLRKLGIPEFTFDFAAEASNTVAACYWDKETNSLAQPSEDWLAMVQQPYMETPGWGWLNPPFSDIQPWAWYMARLRDDGGRCAFLVPAAVGSAWWVEHVHGLAKVLLLNGRIPFDPEKPHWGYPKDMTLCLYSPELEPEYDVWRWESDVPAEMLAAHKAACTKARAREKQEKSAKGTVVRTEETEEG